MDIRIFEEPKIDCHVHVLDPARFPYGASTHYRPLGQELGTPAQLAQVMEAYGTRHALLVGPNSGYGTDNSCMLDTLARGGGPYGTAVGLAVAVCVALAALAARAMVARRRCETAAFGAAVLGGTMAWTALRWGATWSHLPGFEPWAVAVGVLAALASLRVRWSPC